MFDLTQALELLKQHGYVMLPRVFSEPEAASVAERLARALTDPDEPSVLRSRGRTYGARNLLQSFPQVVGLARRGALRALVTQALGPHAGLVRGLFFDKPPDRSWSLPWHRDKTIAVKSSDRPSEHFSKATFKAGVPHVEAPLWLLERMLTLRIHLDAMTQDNGPLAVIPGSQELSAFSAQSTMGGGPLPVVSADEGGVVQGSPVTLQANVGDVLAMRPLLSHASGMSQPGTSAHRRILHLEFAASSDLPDGYQWHDFVAIVAPGPAC